MANPPDLSVVIPAYREEANLKELLPRLSTVLAALDVSSEVIVVVERDASGATMNLYESNGARPVRRVPDDLFGDAIRTGLATVQASRWVIVMDADGSHAPETIPRLLAEASADSSVDVVIASRYVSGGSTENPLPLIVMSRVLNALYAVVLGLKCRDVSTNFKLYRAPLLGGIQLRCKNFDVVEEILVRLRSQKRDLCIVEIPDAFLQRVHGESHRRLGVFVVSYLLTLARLRASTWVGSNRSRVLK